jgi:hypothetical protein
MSDVASRSIYLTPALCTVMAFPLITSGPTVQQLVCTSTVFDTGFTEVDGSVSPLVQKFLRCRLHGCSHDSIAASRTSVLIAAFSIGILALQRIVGLSSLLHSTSHLPGATARLCRPRLPYGLLYSHWQTTSPTTSAFWLRLLSRGP